VRRVIPILDFIVSSILLSPHWDFCALGVLVDT
jgi:hypothetical protein